MISLLHRKRKTDQKCPSLWQHKGLGCCPKLNELTSIQRCPLCHHCILQRRTDQWNKSTLSRQQKSRNSTPELCSQNPSRPENKSYHGSMSCFDWLGNENWSCHKTTQQETKGLHKPAAFKIAGIGLDWIQTQTEGGGGGIWIWQFPSLSTWYTAWIQSGFK